MQKPSTKYLFSVGILVLSIFFFSCQKEIKETTSAPVINNETPPDLSTKIISSVSGFVTDENSQAVSGAAVKAGNLTTSTDHYGYFEIKNAEVVKTAAVVSVTQPGYFKGVKTYMATEGKAAFFRIKLIPKTIAGTINAGAGGNVTFSNGLIVALPANSVVNASTNAAYTGDINVAAYWLNPEGSDLTEVMPGDLRGIDAAGVMKGLTTYGMTAVELTSASGELLQIAAGKKAMLTMPLSALLLSAAPSSIPLWYFDETAGLWKQDGSATKTGSTYVGEVSHFSWWNCDLPNATVPLTFTVVDGNGNPLGDIHVEIVPTSPGSWSHIGGNTDSSGYVSVFVTPNTDYRLELYSSCIGLGPAYSQNFSAGTDAVNLGNLSIGNSITASLSGTVTDCQSAPVTNGFLLVKNGNYFSRYSLTNGAYNFSMLLCSSATDVILIGEDVNALQESTPLPYTLVAGNNSPGNLQACGVSTSELFSLTIDDTTTTYTMPADSLNMAVNSQITPSIIQITGTRVGMGFIEQMQISFADGGISAGSTQQLYELAGHNAIFYTVPSPFDVHISEYGAIGEYIAGTFSGTVTDSGGASHTATGSFRVRRTQ